MKTKFTFLLALSLLTLNACSTISVSKVQCGTSSVSKRNGLLYCLPRTEFDVKVTIEKTMLLPSPLYVGNEETIKSLIAKHKLLDLEVLSQKDSSFEITSIQLTPITKVDSNQLYFIEFRRRNAFFVNRKDKFCFDDGLILTEGTISSEDHTLDASLNLAEKVVSNFIPIPQMGLSQSGDKRENNNYLEKIFLRIVEIRGTRNDLLSGNIGDGSGIYDADISLIIKKFDEEEKQLIQQICGTKKTIKLTETIHINPVEGTTNIFYFSEKLGGSTNAEDRLPVRITIPINSITACINSLFAEKEDQINARNHGVYYRIPYRVNIRIDFNGKQLHKEEVIIPQLGSVGFLPSKVSFFGSSISFEMDGKTGALKKVDAEGKGMDTEAAKNVLDAVGKQKERRISDLEDEIKLLELQNQIEELSKKP